MRFTATNLNNFIQFLTFVKRFFFSSAKEKKRKKNTKKKQREEKKEEDHCKWSLSVFKNDANDCCKGIFTDFTEPPAIFSNFSIENNPEMQTAND